MEKQKESKIYAGNRAKSILDEKNMQISGTVDLFDEIKNELGYSSNKLSYLLNNSKEMKLKEAAVISRVLGVQVEDLIVWRNGNSDTDFIARPTNKGKRRTTKRIKTINQHQELSKK